MGVTPRDFPGVSLPPDVPPPPGLRAEARLDRSALAADKDLRMLIVSSFTDWLAIVAMAVLIGMGALDGGTFGWSIPALASGTIYAKMAGAKNVKNAIGGSSTLALIACGPVALKALAAIIGRATLA